MAEKRMFSKTIIDSDLFLDMSLSAQALYFHLSLRADDEGFINNPKKIIRMTGARDDDFKILIAKQFLIPFESGVVVIKHWRIHNYIRGDRLRETFCKLEKEQLSITDNVYYLPENGENCLTCDSQLPDMCHTQDSIDKDSIDKDSIDIPPEKEPKKNSKSKKIKVVDKIQYAEFVFLKQEEYEKLCKKYSEEGTKRMIEILDNYKGANGKVYKDDYRAILSWVVNKFSEEVKKQNTQSYNKQSPIDILGELYQEASEREGTK